MSERIDHVGTAAFNLGRAKVFGENASWNQAAHATATAQVHATLAPVEQQRIANLIALAQFNVPLSEGGSAGFVDSAVIEMQTEAAKGLGL